MKKTQKIVRIALIATIFVAFINLILNNFELQRFFTFQFWVITFGYGFVMTYMNVTFFNYINNRFEWKNKGIQRILVGAGGSILVTIIGYLFCEFMFSVVLFRRQSIAVFWENQDISDYLLPILITTIISLFFHTVYFYKALQEKKVTEQKIIAGTASAKFAALKNQLDPHFLFNSLNVLTSLIDENPRMAQKFTTSLSKVYRYVLEQKNKELVTVDEELKFAKTYMTLLKLRFEDSIIFEMPEQSINPDAKVVPLSLQLLLENTVKHNVVMPQKPLHIKIYEDDGFLIVENNLQPKEVVKSSSSGVGLGNIQQRYAILTKRAFTVHKTETAFIARLPILTKQIKKIEMNTIINPPIAKEMKYDRAKERVKKMKEFYSNFISYCIIIPFLVFINYWTTSFAFPWVIFPIFGWGLGVLFHYAEAFDRHIFLGKNWEKRKIRQFMNESRENDL